MGGQFLKAECAEVDENNRKACTCPPSLPVLLPGPGSPHYLHPPTITTTPPPPPSPHTLPASQITRPPIPFQIVLTVSDPTNFSFVRPTSAESKEDEYCVATCPPPDVHHDPGAYEACFKACQASHARGFQLAACTSDAATTQWVYRSTANTTSGQVRGVLKQRLTPTMTLTVSLS